MTYEKFLQSKIEIAPESGFSVTEKDLPSKFLDGTILKPLIFTESEGSIKEALLEKWKRHDYLIKKTAS